MRKKERVREVVHHMQVVEKTCLTCQRTFTGVKKSLYCSRACSNKANYQRHAHKRRSARMAKYYKQKEQAAQP